MDAPGERSEYFLLPTRRRALGSARDKLLVLKTATLTTFKESPDLTSNNKRHLLLDSCQQASVDIRHRRRHSLVLRGVTSALPELTRASPTTYNATFSDVAFNTSCFISEMNVHVFQVFDSV